VLFHPESLTSILVLDVVSLDEEFPFVPRKLVVLVKVVSFEHGLCDPFCDGKDGLGFLLILRTGILTRILSFSILFIPVKLSTDALCEGS